MKTMILGAMLALAPPAIAQRHATHHQARQAVPPAGCGGVWKARGVMWDVNGTWVGNTKAYTFTVLSHDGRMIVRTGTMQASKDDPNSFIVMNSGEPMLVECVGRQMTVTHDYDKLRLEWDPAG